MSYRSLLTLALLLSLSLMACQPIQAPISEQTAPQGLRPDAPPYGVRGPFALGYKPLVMDEGTDHPLAGHLWYPALNPTGKAEKVTYAIADNPYGIYGRALLNAEIDGAAGPYPLVLFSHGLGDSPVRWSPLLEHYASY